MEAWGNWMKEHSAQILEMDGPLGRTLAVSKNGIISIINKDFGYDVVRATSHNEAAKMFLNHPHFAILPFRKCGNYGLHAFSTSSLNPCGVSSTLAQKREKRFQNDA